MDRTGETDEFTLNELKMHSSELIVRNAVFRMTSHFALGNSSAGTAENYITPTVTFENSQVTLPSFFGTDGAYVDSTLNLKGATTLTFGHEPRMNKKSNSKFTLNVDKGSSIVSTSGLFILLDGDLANAHVTVNMRGSANVVHWAMDKNLGEGCSATLNVHGTADIAIANTLYVRDYAKVNFKLDGVDSSRVTMLDGGMLIPQGQAIMRAKDLKNSGSADARIFSVDLSDFYIIGSDFVEGQVYAVALITASNLNASQFEILNADASSPSWKLAENDNLVFMDNTAFLLMEYIPEPSAYAAIFGAAALAFSAYRRRRRLGVRKL